MRRSLSAVAGAVALAAALCGAQPASAQEDYPARGRSISIVVPFAAGSGTDAVARVLGEKMAESLKTSVVVDNKPGALGQIASEFVARSTPDGYTLLMGGNSTHSVNPYLVKKLRYDAVKDFTPVGLGSLAPLALLVPAASPVKSAAELVQAGRERSLTYGYANTGGQLSGAMFVRTGSLQANPVPYKDAPRMLTDLASGQLDFAFIDFAAARAMTQANRIRALAATSRNRLVAAKDTPALRETPLPGFDQYEMGSWIGLFGPANLPPKIVEQLNAAMRAALALPDVRDRLVYQMMQEILPLTPAEFTVFLREQYEIYGRRIQEAGLTPE